MFENTTKAAADTTDFLNLIDDLQRSESTELRADPRLPIHAQVSVRPGNLSQRFAWSMRAATADISEGGCKIFANQPLLVGDIYALEFGVEGTPPVLAICRRCRAIQSGKFESGLQFLEPVMIGQGEAQEGEAADGEPTPPAAGTEDASPKDEAPPENA